MDIDDLQKVVKTLKERVDFLDPELKSTNSRIDVLELNVNSKAPSEPSSPLKSKFSYTEPSKSQFIILHIIIKN